MAFGNAGEMSRSLAECGKIALYGIYFDTDKDSVRPESQATLQEIAKLLTTNRSLKVSVVGIRTIKEGRTTTSTCSVARRLGRRSCPGPDTFCRPRTRQQSAPPELCGGTSRRR